MQELKKLYFKTKKDAPSDEVSLNAKLLIRAGFINKEMAGVYDLLPLGLRVANKITQIIRDEMNKLGAQEMFLASLQNPELWKATNRWDDDVYDVWFKTKLKNDAELGMATTHEEPLTNLMTNHIESYKDLPILVYQFQTKFRNELRSKSGILRGREFMMKDLYSFNKNEEDLDKFYENAKQAYINIFERVGIGPKTYVTFASGGTFSKFSHEFQTVCDAGEDIIYVDENKKVAVNKEVYTDEVLNDLGLKKEELKEIKAIEVGNIFKLKTKYSAALGLKYKDEKGEDNPVIMGSYGIGIGRVMGTVVELFNDQKGIKWPLAIAPYQIHIVCLNDNLAEQTKEIAKTLENAGYEVLIDTSEDKAGEKFANADLIGCPLRIVVSEKNNTNDELELKLRSEESAIIVNKSELLEKVKSLLPYGDNSKS